MKIQGIELEDIIVGFVMYASAIFFGMLGVASIVRSIIAPLPEIYFWVDVVRFIGLFLLSAAMLILAHYWFASEQFRNNILTPENIKQV